MSKNLQQKIEIAKCPFNKNHIISSDKLLTHIRKCKEKQFSNLIRCKYSQYHWYNINQIKVHQQACSQKFSTIPMNQIDDNQQNQQTKYIKKSNQFSENYLSQPFLDQISIIQSSEKKAQKRVIAVKKNKQKKKQEKEQLWKQPNFEEWVDQQIARKKKKKGNTDVQTSNFLEQSCFDFDLD